MDCPPGMKCETGQCLLLLKSLYGLVQSARQFFKMLVSILKKIGFKQSSSEPCMLVNNDEDGVIIIAIYVDDCYAIGSEKAIQKTIKGIQANGLEFIWEVYQIIISMF